MLSLPGNTGLLSLLWRLLWGSGKPHMAGVHSGQASLALSFPDPAPGSLTYEEGSLSSFSLLPSLLSQILPVCQPPQEPHFYLVCKLPQEDLAALAAVLDS